MAADKHTPGPWKFELAPSGGFDIEKDPNDLGRYMVIATRTSHPDRAAEMHANARLIAAAPDMLDALRKAVVALAGVMVHAPQLGIDAQYKAVSDAIAKATGLDA